MRIRVLSLNLHKARNPFSRRSTLAEIKSWLHAYRPDIAFFQEVIGEGDRSSWPNQFELLADAQWKSFAYGKNAVSDGYSHGNAILSQFPIQAWENFDLSTNRYERRGLLAARIGIPGHGDLAAFCCHLNLMRASRVAQMKRLPVLAEAFVHSFATPDRKTPTVLCGDFNDWRSDGNEVFSGAGWEEAGTSVTGSPLSTYPAWLPFLPLDRVYVRGLRAKEAAVLPFPDGRLLSDHLAIFSELEIP